MEEGKPYSHAAACAGLRHSDVDLMPVPSPFFLLLQQLTDSVHVGRHRPGKPCGTVRAYQPPVIQKIDDRLYRRMLPPRLHKGFCRLPLQIPLSAPTLPGHDVQIE